MTEAALQDSIPWSYCFGCGPANHRGLQIKSHSHGDEYISVFQAQEHHAAGPKHFVNGGIIATVIDCHCVWTAIADCTHREGRRLGEEPIGWHATGSLHIDYLRPVPIGAECQLVSRVTAVDGKQTAVSCTVFAAGKERARAQVVAVRVPDSWVQPTTS